MALSIHIGETCPFGEETGYFEVATRAAVAVEVFDFPFWLTTYHLQDSGESYAHKNMDDDPEPAHVVVDLRRVDDETQLLNFLAERFMA